MPTIQVRTDDRTKTASTALFQRLGITMSDSDQFVSSAIRHARWDTFSVDLNRNTGN